MMWMPLYGFSIPYDFTETASASRLVAQAMPSTHRTSAPGRAADEDVRPAPLADLRDAVVPGRPLPWLLVRPAMIVSMPFLAGALLPNAGLPGGRRSDGLPVPVEPPRSNTKPATPRAATSANAPRRRRRRAWRRASSISASVSWPSLRWGGRTGVAIRHDGSSVSLVELVLLAPYRLSTPASDLEVGVYGAPAADGFDIQ